MTAEEALRANLSGPLGLPDVAVAWLMDLWSAVQGLDDLVDGAAVTDKYGFVWTVLIGLPSNGFFSANAQDLLPVMANAYAKWRAAEAVELLGKPSPMSFAWRAGYYDVVLQCVLLVHGSARAAQLAPVVMQLYGERLEDYMKEFEHA